MSVHNEDFRKSGSIIPDDDLQRELATAKVDDAIHLGVVGDTYTILLSGSQTAGRYSLIDMLVAPGGGPPPHRHNFEESFTLLEGEIEATFRGKTAVIKVGETINIPANAPHQFRNASAAPARLLCICSPAGEEELFKEVGVPVATRTTPAPKLDEAEETAFRTKSAGLAAKYQTVFLDHA